MESHWSEDKTISQNPLRSHNTLEITHTNMQRKNRSTRHYQPFLSLVQLHFIIYDKLTISSDPPVMQNTHMNKHSLSLHVYAHMYRYLTGNLLYVGEEGEVHYLRYPFQVQISMAREQMVKILQKVQAFSSFLLKKNSFTQLKIYFQMLSINCKQTWKGPGDVLVHRVHQSV